MMEEIANENKPKQIVTQDLPNTTVTKEATDIQTLKADGSVGFTIATKEEKVMSGLYLGSTSDDEEGSNKEEDGSSSEATVNEAVRTIESGEDTDGTSSDDKKTTTGL